MDNTFVQELDPIVLVRAIGRKNKKMQAILLQELEKVMDKESPEYDTYRKIILDESNNYARAIVRLIFGDIEYTLH
jgi:hypothetical protein